METPRNWANSAYAGWTWAVLAVPEWDARVESLRAICYVK
jgi:hypothetical protein